MSSCYLYFFFTFCSCFVIRKHIQRKTSTHYELALAVGGGSAGCRLAEKLSSVKYFNVLLIEAGGTPPVSSKIPMMASLALTNPKFDWQIPSEPQKFAMLSNVGQVTVERLFTRSHVLPSQISPQTQNYCNTSFAEENIFGGKGARRRFNFEPDGVPARLSLRFR